MAVKVLAVDPGKHSTKALTIKADGSENFISFRTKMEETEREYAQGNSYIVCYKGKRYLLGEQASKSSSKTSKTEDIHKIATYAAIHKLAESGDEIVIAVGCPLSVFENREKKNEYKKFLFPERELNITVNNVTKHFVIKGVTILPESSGIIYEDKEKYEKISVGIVDIGGLNVNCCVYDKTVPVLASLFTDNLGSNVLRTNLKKAIEQHYGEDIPEYQMEEILVSGYVVDNMAADGVWEGSREFISNFKKKHIETILEKCSANGWNMRTIKLVFVGGTTGLLSKEIREKFPGAEIVSEPEKANVRGFLKVII